MFKSIRQPRRLFKSLVFGLMKRLDTTRFILEGYFRGYQILVLENKNKGNNLPSHLIRISKVKCFGVVLSKQDILDELKDIPIKDNENDFKI